jgi:hypothetical protein
MRSRMAAKKSPSTGSGVLRWDSRYVLSPSDFGALEGELNMEGSSGSPWLRGLCAGPIGARRLAVAAPDEICKSRQP